MSITAQQVSALRGKTGAGMMDCKRALVEAEGDEQKAVKLLRQKGLAKAAGKRSRETGEGLIVSYVHHGRIGVLLELSCETDFVARNEQFRRLADDLAMHVAAMNPLVVSPEDVSEERLEVEREVYRAQFADKPEQVRERIVDGKLKAYYEQACLLNQEYVRDESRRVGDVIKDAIAKLGENIQVRRFVRFDLGGPVQ